MLDYYGTSTIWVIALALFFLSIILVQADFEDWKGHQDQDKQARMDANRGSGRHRSRNAYGACSRSEPVSEQAALLSSHIRPVDDTGDSSNTSTDDGKPDYKWPRTSFMVADFALALFSAFAYFNELGFIDSGCYSYRSGGNVIVRSYVSICTLSAAVIHAKCWWTEFMAKRKQSWEDERRGTWAEQTPFDIEAANATCRCTPGQLTDNQTEESRILHRILTFLGKRNRTVGDDEEGDVNSVLAQQTDDEVLTPESSHTAAGSTSTPHMEDADASATESHTEASQVIDAAHQDPALVVRKKSKKGKARSETRN